MNEPQREHRLIQILLLVLGAAAVGIGVMVFVLGLQAVNLVAGVFDALIGQPAASAQPVSASIDSEFRFYAVFWFTYGLMLLRIARTMGPRIKLVPLMMALFFLGGIGRLISYATVGAPHPVFALLMGIELVFPVIVMALYLRLKNRNLIPA